MSDAVSRGLKSIRKAVQGSGGQAAAKQPSADPVRWVKHLKAADGGKVAGVATTRVSGSLSGKAMAKDVKRMFKQASAGAAVPVSLPAGFGRDFQAAVAKARIQAWVGTQDKIVRRLRVTVSGDNPADVLKGGSKNRYASVLDLRLAKVNAPQGVAAPKQLAKKPLRRKQLVAGQGAFVVASMTLDAPSGLAQTSVGLLRVAALSRATRVPNKVDRAIKAHKRVILFFHQAGADDNLTGAGVAALRRRTKALVVSDSVSNLASYGEVVQSVGVARAPSVVIIGRSGRARLIEGYIDPEALAQEVADTR
jgi:hypothetical protein